MARDWTFSYGRSPCAVCGQAVSHCGSAQRWHERGAKHQEALRRAGIFTPSVKKAESVKKDDHGR